MSKFNWRTAEWYKIPILGWSQYRVTVHKGTVYVLSLDYRGSTKPRLLKPKIATTGSRSFGNRYYHYLTTGQLVLIAILGKPKPNKNAVAEHKNGQINDDRPCNLKWGTFKSVGQSQIDRGTRPQGVACSQAICTAAEVRRIRKLRKRGWSIAAIAKETGHTQRIVYRIAANRTYRDLDYEPPILVQPRSNTKLTTTRVLRIHSLRTLGWSMSKIAFKLGISITSVWNVLNGKLCAYVKPPTMRAA
jgi:lambda repressor-like predicted transcriptional regulator